MGDDEVGQCGEKKGGCRCSLGSEKTKADDKEVRGWSYLDAEEECDEVVLLLREGSNFEEGAGPIGLTLH